PQVELYLQKTYSVAELQAIADKLGISDIRQMMRTKDELYKELGLDNPTLSQ
ncbi:arsenate reductase, partial [Aggregatibacter actinomycetemcomitans serotype e str. ANH9776]